MTKELNGQMKRLMKQSERELAKTNLSFVNDGILSLTLSEKSTT